jgi:hypothetical protein
MSFRTRGKPSRHPVLVAVLLFAIAVNLAPWLIAGFASGAKAGIPAVLQASGH